MELVPLLHVDVVDDATGRPLDTAAVQLLKLPKGGTTFELGRGPQRAQLLTYLGDYQLKVMSLVFGAHSSLF